jgi:hypothetical protein
VRLRGERLLSTRVLWGTVCVPRTNKWPLLSSRFKLFLTDVTILFFFLIQNIGTHVPTIVGVDYGDSLLHGCNKTSQGARSRRNETLSNLMGVTSV